MSSVVKPPSTNSTANTTSNAIAMLTHVGLASGICPHLVSRPGAEPLSVGRPYAALGNPRNRG